MWVIIRNSHKVIHKIIYQNIDCTTVSVHAGCGFLIWSIGTSELPISHAAIAYDVRFCARATSASKSWALEPVNNICSSERFDRCTRRCTQYNVNACTPSLRLFYSMVLIFFIFIMDTLFFRFNCISFVSNACFTYDMDTLVVKKFR